MIEMSIEQSCGAIIFRKGEEIKYLLLHYGAGHWDFVKGNVEKGEGEKETVVREIKEETGIEDVMFIDNFREEISYFYKRRRKMIYKEVVFYLVQTRTKEVKLSYEHIGYAWLNYPKALGKLTYKNAKDVLKKANELLSQ
jgi:8-oxo-dGTP pyrophosphatase MutT (NUDIX family)